MKRRLLISLMTAGAALGSGVASANANYWAQNGLLLEVSADPRDGSDTVQTNPVHAASLELVALNDNVRLRGMTVRFADGRTFTQQNMRTIRAGERVTIDLPENCGTIQGVQLDYGEQIVDRTTARLQIIPHDGRQIAAMPTRPVVRDHRWSRYNDRPTHHVTPYQAAYVAPQPTYVAPQPTYSYQPSYSYQTTTPTYVVPAPRPTSNIGVSGYIQGSFRF